MEIVAHVESGDRQRPAPGWRTVALVLAFYTACIIATTYPRIWTMGWYKLCLLEGRSPLICPDVEYPVGAPLANWPSMHYQTLLYLPLSYIFDNDVLCYNIISYLALILTGYGTFLLAWHVLGDRACACFGGMLAMLSPPILGRSCGHIEFLHVGWFPLFLIAWMRLVDEPGRRRLLAAAALYVLMAMSAGYFAVFGVFPGALYLAWQAARAGRRGDWAWFRSRAPWMLAFIALTGSGLLLTFSSQLWSVAQGHLVTRPRGE